MNTVPVRIGIAGASGYTGSELVRLLARHPHVRIERLTAENHAGERFCDLYPAFRGLEERRLEPLDALLSADLDLLFLALPNGVSMEFIRRFGAERCRIIDLSGDFRLRSHAMYEQWYRQPHAMPEYLGKAVYGLSELYRAQIAAARLVSNPGCYPTAAVLLLAPLMRRGLIRPTGIIVDGKSGVTGAGATPRFSTHFPELHENLKPYELLRHRHTPEMEQALSDVAGGPVELLFTPHRLPVDRGLLVTAYAHALPGVTGENLRAALAEQYAGEPFIRLCDVPPHIKQVRGSSFCDLFVTLDTRTGLVVGIAALDNLVKGAAGQAVQNMNLMFGWPETTGLGQPPLCP